MADNDTVGYGKPPKSSQFKPGQSGNPNGRPKGIKNLKTDLAEELSEQVIIHEGGHKKTVTKQRAMVKAMTAKALSGDINAITRICGLVERLLLPDEEPGAETPLSFEDQEILKRFVERYSPPKDNGVENAG